MRKHGGRNMQNTQTGIDDMKVLLVEDNFESMSLIRNLLQDFGITQIYTAKNGMDALMLLATWDTEDFVDVVLCDWKQPRISGTEMLKQMRACNPDMLFLIITGQADIESVTEAKSCGVTGYIKKPFSSNELRKKLRLMARIMAHRSNARLVAKRGSSARLFPPED